jgi:hypothetical protein
MTTTYTQHRVRLVGHRDLGTVRARWVGCILELEDGTRYGPSALFEVVPVAEPVSKPEPVGTWGGHTDWIAWGGGACPVPADALVQAVYRRETVQSYAAMTQSACHWCWTHDDDTPSDIIAYRLATPAAPPVQEPSPEPKPAAVLLRGWRHIGGSCWVLANPNGRTVAAITETGWYLRGEDPEQPRATGLLGKEQAAAHLLQSGATWETDDRWRANADHTPEAIRRFRPDDVAVMVDGTRRTVVGSRDSWLLFTDGTWLTHEAAETAIAARVPADDGIPF